MARGRKELRPPVTGRDGFTLAPSSRSTVTDPLVHPRPEDYWGGVNQVGIRGVYDKAKRHAETITMAYQSPHVLLKDVYGRAGAETAK